ncbi:phosphoribosyltransferase [Methylosinus sp. RM1]|uniref:phosphoribosyltransferase n=1 Tax=Methylosinus sp. RM1 TaxID=2583817 RepID=UPI0014080C90|nr:phosphoribosyltransferase family protein [Methylosinus sp. RM1]
MPFRDRDDAGRRLADALGAYAGEAAVVYALPRGGVPVAAHIAERLKAPLDLVLVRKIGVPYQPELAMGALADGGAPIIVRNEDVIAAAEVTESVFQAVCARERAEIERRREAYLGGRARPDPAGKLAVVVDDGVATGATTRAALRAVRALHPRKLILAIPVAPTDALAALRREADAIVCLEHYRDFGAIGFFYENFHQVDDEEVIAILDRFTPLS